ncbi:MAG: cytochrome c peroxidase [Bacteroidota bacterium]
MIVSQFSSRSFLIACFLILLACISCEENIAPDPGDDDGNPTTPKSPSEIISAYLNLELDAPANYSSPSLPAHYRTPMVEGNINTPANNPVTNDGATLGRVLFYDKQLSINNTIACASCHTQATGFTDANRLSEGFEGGLTGAHSMRLGNTNYYSGAAMFWDKRAADLEEQSTQPIQDAIEMGFEAVLGGMDSLNNKLASTEYYPILFDRAFGSQEITEDRIQKALSQFIRSMVSTDSKFDQGLAEVFDARNLRESMETDFPNFSTQENLGKRLFFAVGGQGGMGGGNSCNTCHQAPTFALSNNSRSNGLDRGESTVFKSPSLKNLAIVGNYMHDGRFESLREVIDHYAEGVQDGPALDQRLRLPGRNGTPITLNLSEEERNALVAFLETLTDESLISDEKFSDPFK